VGAENVSGRPPAPLAAELPAGLLSWIKPVWCYPEPEVIDLCGLDVAVFFRLMQLGECTRCAAQYEDHGSKAAGLIDVVCSATRSLK
jgi:hypothetical protein